MRREMAVAAVYIRSIEVPARCFDAPASRRLCNVEVIKGARSGASKRPGAHRKSLSRYSPDNFLPCRRSRNPRPFGPGEGLNVGACRLASAAALIVRPVPTPGIALKPKLALARLLQLTLSARRSAHLPHFFGSSIIGLSRFKLALNEIRYLRDVLAYAWRNVLTDRREVMMRDRQ